VAPILFLADIVFGNEPKEPLLNEPTPVSKKRPSLSGQFAPEKLEEG
jgi:hypothetical protein